MVGYMANKMHGMSLLATFGLSIALIASSALADISVGTPIASQLPAIARPGKSYSWSFSENTFNTDNAAHQVSYQVEGLPQWVQFDSSSRTFSGSPEQGDVGSPRVTIVASQEGGDQARDTFTLLTLAGNAPTLNKPLPEQLSTASSLGRENVLPGNRQHVPIGWSFSIGFAGDTFTSGTGAVHVAARLGDGTPIPDWLMFDSTMTLYGVAPVSLGREGLKFDVVLFAAERPGFSEVSSSFTMVISESALTMPKSLQRVNMTAGSSFNAIIPTDGLLLNGRPSVDAISVSVQPDTSDFTWISFDEGKKELSGTPPFDFTSDSATTVLVPVHFNDAQNNTLDTNLTISVFPAPFTVEQLPNVSIKPGKQFEINLAKYVRPGADGNKALNATFEPASVGSWIKLDPQSLQLSGQPPQGSKLERVKVTLQALNTREAAPKTTSFYLDPNGKASDAPSPAEKNNDQSADQGSSGLSTKAKIAISASLGSVGALVLMILLMMCCCRCCAAERHDTQGRSIDYDTSGDDDRTLTEGKSPMMVSDWKGSPVTQKWRKAKLKEHANPYPGAEQSPFSDAHTLAPGLPHQEKLTEIRVGDREMMANVAADRGHTDADRPRRSVMLGFLKNKTPSGRNLVRDATYNSQMANQRGSIGLGLEGMGQPDSDNPYSGGRGNNMGHSRSFARSSWENDIWQNQGSRASSPMSETLSSGGSRSDSPNEVPVRRGVVRPMRHRNAHINDSPALNLGHGFDTRATEGNRNSQASRASHRWADADEDLQETDDPEEAADAVVARIRKVQVEPSSIVRPAQQVSLHARQRSTSHHANALNNLQGAFDDAEDEPEYVDDVVRRQSTRGGADRDSKDSYMPGLDSADISAVRFFDSHRGIGRPSTTPAPHLKAEETVRAVPPSNVPLPPTPLFPSADIAAGNTVAGQTQSRARTSSVSSTATKPCQKEQHVDAVPGQLIRVKVLSGSHAPPIMSGAPDSPGKRSGKRLNYIPVLQDEKYMKYWGTRPEFLEWLTWDSRMQELSGTVPPKFGPTPLKLRITILARSVYVAQQVPPSPALRFGPHSPSKKHSRAASFESTATALDDEVVAVVVLHIQKAGSNAQALAI